MLSFDPDNLSFCTGNYIDGKHIPSNNNQIQVHRPSDGKAYALIPESGIEGVTQAVEIAEEKRISSGWSSCSPRQRGAILRRWADLIEKDAIYLGQLEALGSTRPITDVINHEIPFTAEAIRFYAECTDKYSGDLLPTRKDSLGMLIPEPYGVVGAITPWNFPLSMASWKCGPALAAGNAVVLKPSELTPFSTLRLAELAVKAGLPAGVLNVVQGSGLQTGSELVKHPLIRKVSFTGSTVTGAQIMSDAGFNGMKPVTLELGGKSPQLVFNDAGNPVDIAQRIARGFIANGGQACVAGTRLIVQRAIAPALLEQLILLCQQCRPGYTWLENSRYSPLIDSRQGNKVQRLIQQSCVEGAEVLAGGKRFEHTEEGWFWQPTLLINVGEDNCAVQEEIFGPVLTVQYFDEIEEGIALAQHDTYGLCAGVHTQSLTTAMRSMQSLNAGTVWVNRYGRSGDFIIPTGGFMGSGIGKDLGRQAFQACQRQKSVLIDF